MITYDQLVILTPYSGNKNNLDNTISKVINQLDENDTWIIVLDNQNYNEFIHMKKKYANLIFLNYVGPRGAGNCRNLGLDYIIKKIKGEFLLLPLDGDDTLVDFGVNLIKKKLKNEKFKIVSFGHCKIWSDGTKRYIKYSGIYNLFDLLKRYITPCGSTVIKIDKADILRHFRFSFRFRANDALFFYQAVKYFGQFKCYPEILLNYNIGNKNSLSGKKFKMIYYKYKAFKDFGLNSFQAFYYILHYIIKGIRRYYFKCRR